MIGAELTSDHCGCWCDYQSVTVDIYCLQSAYRKNVLKISQICNLRKSCTVNIDHIWGTEF